MSIRDEAVSAALKATNEGGFYHITGVSVVAILEAAAPHLLKNMRQLDLYEIEMRDNPERMKAARSRMREEARAVRAEENKAWAEQTRLDQEEAFDAGFTACSYEHTKQRQDPTYPITRINPYRAGRA